MRRILMFTVVLFWGVFDARAQQVAVPDSETTTARAGQITIRTDVDSAIVFIDSVQVGQTPLTLKDVRPGFHHVRIVHPDVTNWLTGSIIDSAQIQPGEEKSLRYNFGRRYLVLSVPSGAGVYSDDSLMGQTPYLLTVQGLDSIPALSLRRPGYDSAAVNLSEAQRGVLTVPMKKLWTPDQQGDESDEAGISQKHGTFRVYLAGAITVGFGAAAAYFKIQADDKNDQYLQGLGSPSRSQIRVYDTAAAICLGFAEVGFGFMTYFLLTE